jgi:aspartate kinase
MSQLVVMKFGGSSVADADRIKNVANRVIAKRKAGHRVVVVVSAPGDMTDDLIEMAEKITDAPPAGKWTCCCPRASRSRSRFCRWPSTTRGFTRCRSRGRRRASSPTRTTPARASSDIKPKKIFEQLKKGRVVIVAGFQGLNPNEDITTLGRGGSDLTAVALAAP